MLGYVFSSSLGGDPALLAEASSHEAGHLFGLQHQSVWTFNTLTQQYHQTRYNPGGGVRTPIMGVAYDAPRLPGTTVPAPVRPHFKMTWASSRIRRQEVCPTTVLATRRTILPARRDRLAAANHRNDREFSRPHWPQ